MQIDLSKGICLHAHRIDHIAHLGPSVAAGLGTLLSLDVEITYQAIGQALHTTTTTRQSRKGAISSWKAYAPAFASKMAVEAIDRALRGEASPSPIYEGEDGVIAWLLDGPDASYQIPLPAPGEAKEALLESYTKEYSAEYHAQAFIDLAKRMRGRVGDTGKVVAVTIVTSEHTHKVIGTGANDPQKFDPDASRETLDHSLPYIFAVALEDGSWHHERSYARHRSHRPSTIRLWRVVQTVQDAAVDAALPRRGAEGESLRRTCRDRARGREPHRGRAGASRRPPSRRPPLREGPVHLEVPPAHRGHRRPRRAGSLPRDGDRTARAAGRGADGSRSRRRGARRLRRRCGGGAVVSALRSGRQAAGATGRGQAAHRKRWVARAIAGRGAR